MPNPALGPFEIDPTSQRVVRPPAEASVMLSKDDLRGIANRLKALYIVRNEHGGFNPFKYMRDSGLPIYDQETSFEFMGLLSQLANPDLSDGDFMTIATCVTNSPVLQKLLGVKP